MLWLISFYIPYELGNTNTGSSNYVVSPNGYLSQATTGSSQYSNSNLSNGYGITNNKQNNGGSTNSDTIAYFAEV
jgi:hypothetical protein